MSYAEFIERKMRCIPQSGIEPVCTAEWLYPWQCQLVERALRAGRFCLFTDTGTGKTAMQIEWSRQVSALGRVLIIAPLSVAGQTKREAEKFGVEIDYRRGSDNGSQIVVTNYEQLDKFNADDFSGVVLDESSILKSFDGSTKTMIISKFAGTPYRLACTATPAPNDHVELGNHAEFLGVKTSAEMLSEFFIHDGGDTSKWRLKGHARDMFWRWVCGWSAVMSNPSDLGYQDDRYVLPDLRYHEHIIPADHSDAKENGMLFLMPATRLIEQRRVRKSTKSARVDVALKLVDIPEKSLVWCELNDEQKLIAAAIGDCSVSISGSDSFQDKISREESWRLGDRKILISKPKIFGFGMNWQHCNNVVFLGVSHSFEQTYQAIRRCWRFGQTKPVDVHFIRSELEAPIVKNFSRKELAHRELIKEMVANQNDGYLGKRWNDYSSKSLETQLPAWLMGVNT